MLRVKIEKLIFGGQALGRLDNKICFVWGALPGEEVEFEITKSKKNFVEGIATKIITAAPERVAPVEDHYLCCSPWSVMSYQKENEWKKIVSLETYKKLGDISFSEIDLAAGENEYHYRNKIEFSFVAADDQKISLAFFSRGGQHYVPLAGCALALDAINEAAQRIVRWINTLNLSASTFKSLIGRANDAGEVIAALFIRADTKLDISNLVDENLVGFQVYYSRPLCPASSPDKRLNAAGQNYLEEKLLGATLRYGALSFFQINPPVFEIALHDIKKFIEPGSRVADYFSGVGSISLPLAHLCKDLVLVENNPEAVHYAEENININKIKNARAILANAGDAGEYLSADQTVIIDPPRTGLDTQIRYNLIKIRPQRLIYLSCDIATQARDLKLLSPFYRIIFHRLYNFFPRTPHIEALVVLERI